MDNVVRFDTKGRYSTTIHYIVVLKFKSILFGKKE